MKERVFTKILRPTRQSVKNLHATATAVFSFEFKATYRHLFVIWLKGSAYQQEGIKHWTTKTQA